MAAGRSVCTLAVQPGLPPTAPPLVPCASGTPGPWEGPFAPCHNPRMHARRADRPPRARRFPALATVLVACLLSAAGCGPLVPQPLNSPSASPSALATASASPSGSPAGPASATPDPATVYATIEQQVVALRGLQARSPVEPKVLDDQQLKAHIQTTFQQDNPPAVVSANERLLKGLGLFPKDASLSALYVELLSSQVQGLYSPKDKQLYVVSKTGGLGPLERWTFSHEFTHALQDQNFDLQSVDLNAQGESDRDLARLSLVEGDATDVMTLWAQQNLTPDELVQILRASLDPAALKILEKMPPILREPLGFPYDNGLRFVMGLQQRGGWKAVDEAFHTLPASTEQILHPEKYDAAEAPVAIDVPKDLDLRMGNGWKVGLQDTLGEFQLGIWLRLGVSSVPATAAAAGWGGDRVTLLDGPNGSWAIAMMTAWDTTADAVEFADAAGQVLAKSGMHGTVNAPPGSKNVTVLLGSDATVATKIDTIAGETGT